MKSPVRLVSLGGILLSAFICLSAVQLRGGIAVPDFMLFPLLLGLSLMAVSGVVFVQSKGGSSWAGLFPPGEGRKVLYLLGTFLFSLFIFESAGFAVSIFLLITLLLKGIGGKTAGQSIFYGLTIALSTYLFFSRIMGVRLPPGIVGF